MYWTGSNVSDSLQTRKYAAHCFLSGQAASVGAQETPFSTQCKHRAGFPETAPIMLLWSTDSSSRSFSHTANWMDESTLDVGSREYWQTKQSKSSMLDINLLFKVSVGQLPSTLYNTQQQHQESWQRVNTHLVVTASTSMHELLLSDQQFFTLVTFTLDFSQLFLQCFQLLLYVFLSLKQSRR